MVDTICTEEQPCGKTDCPNCDPFYIAPRSAAVDPAPHFYDPQLEMIVTVSTSDQSDKWNVPPAPVSPIPSLDDCYQTMLLRYTEYENAVAKLAIAENNVTEDRIALEQAKTEVLLRYTDPKEPGSNEAQRSAAIAFHTSLQTQKLQAAQRSVELLKCEAEVARIRCRMCDNTLRFCEALISDKGYTEYAEA